MKGCRQPLPLLWLTAVVAMNILGSHADVVEEDTLQVKNLTDKLLQVIPDNCNSSSVTELVIEGSLITLNEADRLALASYPELVELHLDGNLVTSIPAKYFSVVPHLRVLSLSRNNISSLDPESFSGLDVLTVLDLSHNLLTSLHTQLFSQLNNLQVLNLQENPWNCSCPLLSSIGEAKAAGVNIGGVTCASPEKQAGSDVLQATAMCYPSPPPPSPPSPPPPPSSPPPIFTTDSQNPANSQQSLGSSTMLVTTGTPSQNRNIDKDQTPVLGNSWKFTAGVVALALGTSMLIVFGIKGPSWYKLFNDYRHKRLRQDEEEDEEGVVSTVFSGTGRYLNQQTFTFEQENGQIDEEEEEEEEEDGYFEDPYIRREESHAGEETSAEP